MIERIIGPGPPAVPEPVADLAERRRRKATRPIALAAAAAAIVALAIGFASFRNNDFTGTSVDDIIASPDAVVTELDGESGTITIAWSPERNQVAVVATGLEQAAPGSEYALWFVTADGVAPAGLFRPKQGTVSAVLDVDDIATEGWGITVEPVGGSPQPTGEILYSGTV